MKRSDSGIFSQLSLQTKARVILNEYQSGHMELFRIREMLDIVCRNESERAELRKVLRKEMVEGSEMPAEIADQLLKDFFPSVTKPAVPGPGTQTTQAYFAALQIEEKKKAAEAAEEGEKTQVRPGHPVPPPPPPPPPPVQTPVPPSAAAPPAGTAPPPSKDSGIYKEIELPKEEAGFGFKRAYRTFRGEIFDKDKLEATGEVKKEEPPRRAPSILIADDEKGARLVYRLKLQELGYKVTEAADGIEAWEQVRSGQYDLMIMDMKMPRLHGLEILLMMEKEGIDLPGVICTAYSQMQDEYAVTSYPRFKFLTKPVAQEKLVAAVQEFLPKP